MLGETFSRDNEFYRRKPQCSVIRLWTVPDGKLQATLTGHLGPVVALAPLPGKDQGMVSADSEGDILVWNLGTKRSKPLESLGRPGK
jgi:WD40 repeat protein